MKITTTTAFNCYVRGPVLTVLATVCLAAASLPARAGDFFAEVDAVKKTVTYADLNLANPRGVEELYRRISAASQHVCRTLDGASLERKEQFSICTTQSIARAVAAVDQPALTALQAVKTGQHEWIARVAKQ